MTFINNYIYYYSIFGKFRINFTSMAANTQQTGNLSPYAVIGFLALEHEESKNSEHDRELKTISDEDFELRQLVAECVAATLINTHVNTKTCNCVEPSSIPGECDECDEFMSTLTEKIADLSLAYVRERRAE